MIKAVFLLVLVAFVRAEAPIAYGGLGYGSAVGLALSYGALAITTPVAYAQADVQPAPVDFAKAETDDPPYKYGYSVADQNTDSESPDQGQGTYSIVEPDGSVHTVTYTADGENGFKTVDEL